MELIYKNVSMVIIMAMVNTVMVRSMAMVIIMGMDTVTKKKT